MTHYEELGITADAADEEIRQAHRRLVKLLHPDQQLDDQLRRIAELQLMRVNVLVEQLLDPVQRKLYDMTLRGPMALPPVAVERHVVESRTILEGWKYAAAGAAAVVVAAILTTSSPTDVVRSVMTAQASSPPVPAVTIEPKPVAATPARPPLRMQAPGNAPRGVVASPSPTVPAVAVEPHRQEHVVEAPPLPAPAPVAAAPPVEARNEPSLSGVWLYAGGKKSDRDQGLYRPEYIELRISEEGSGGALHGEYRSRYAVTDLPISPNVNFSFQGAATAASLPWRGPKGSSGTVVLKLLRRL
jgi:DnaJ domain